MSGSWMYRAAGKAISGSAKAGARMGEGVSYGISNWRSSRSVRRGFLVPGDPPPPPNAPTDYLDYRGVATRPEVGALTGAPFRIGRFVDLKRSCLRDALGIPAALLNRHALIVGPAGSGKTHGLLIPWMDAALKLGWSVVAVDVKGDLREDFLAYHAQEGGQTGARLWKWDFSDARRSITWDWLSELTDDARIDAAVTAVMKRPSASSSADPYFYNRDYRILRGLLRFAGATRIADSRPGSLIAAVENRTTLAAAVQSAPRAPGASDLLAALQYSTAEYPKVISGVVTALAPLDTADVAAVTSPSGRTRLNLDTSLDEHRLLIIGAPLRGGQVSATLSSLILSQLTQRLYERFGSDRRPVLLVVDEAAQMTERVDLAQLMEVGRSARVGVTLALQDLAKIRDENDRSSVITNAATFGVFPGCSAITLDAFKRRLGERYERTNSMSTSATRGTRIPSHSYSTELVPVLRDREISEVPIARRSFVAHINARDLNITGKPIPSDLERGS